MFSQYLKSIKSSGNLAVKYKKRKTCATCAIANKPNKKKNEQSQILTQKWGWKSGTLWTKKQKKQGDVTRTVDGGEWLICTVQCVTADCAWWTFGLLHESPMTK